jgi:hypothetical protein
MFAVATTLMVKVKLSLCLITHHTMKTYGEERYKKWNILLYNNKLNPDLPQNKTVAFFILHTRHDCLAAHFQRLSILPHPHCILCNDPNCSTEIIYSNVKPFPKSTQK